MNKTRKSVKFAALAAASALVFAACGGDDDDDGAAETEAPAEEEATEEETAETEAPAEEEGAEGAEGAAGGTYVWAHEQEPPDLHVDDPENNLSIASWILPRASRSGARSRAAASRWCRMCVGSCRCNRAPAAV